MRHTQGGPRNQRRWVYEFPPLEQFRANVESVMRVKISEDQPEERLVVAQGERQRTTLAPVPSNVIALAGLSGWLRKNKMDEDCGEETVVN